MISFFCSRVGSILALILLSACGSTCAPINCTDTQKIIEELEPLSKGIVDYIDIYGAPPSDLVALESSIKSNGLAELKRSGGSSSPIYIFRSSEIGKTVRLQYVVRSEKPDFSFEYRDGRQDIVCSWYLAVFEWKCIRR